RRPRHRRRPGGAAASRGLGSRPARSGQGRRVRVPRSGWPRRSGPELVLGAVAHRGGTAVHPRGVVLHRRVQAYGYRGLGEVAVFVFFGLVAVIGTQFTQLGSVTWYAVVAAVAVGSFSCAVNLTNNLRDIPSDAETGKITLAVRLG